MRILFTLLFCLSLSLALSLAAQELKSGLSPQEAVKAFTMPEGFKASLIAAEPDLVQPIAFDFDDRGRLWVAEFKSYPKWAPTGNDRILIFEDTTGTGHYDKCKVFWDKGNHISGFQLGFGGVFVCCAPNLLYIPIKEDGDTPAAEPVVLLDGWSTKGGHNVFNGLTWGLDGWLYGCNGILCKSTVGKPGTPDNERVPFNCGIWRYHPVQHKFETVVHGTTNPWGIDFDDDGQMFFTNTVIGHLWHVIPGAHFKRMFGEDFNPNVYDLIEQCADHIHWAGGSWTTSRGGKDKHGEAGGGHSHCGAMIYLGANWPEQYRNSLFTLNTHGNRVNNDILARKGSGMVGTHGKDFMFANDQMFRGVTIKSGPDGGVFVSDWNQGGECHSGSDVTTGRIYKITYGDTKPVSIDLQKLSDPDLVNLHLDKDEWYVRHARRILQERKTQGKLAPETYAALLKIYKENPSVPRKLRALWTLFATGGATPEFLASQLDHEDENIRVWAIKLLAEQPITDPVAVKFAAMAKSDTSAMVHVFIASTLQLMTTDQRWDILANLISHAEDAGDHNLPLMLWYAMEPLVPLETARALALAGNGKISLLRQYAARRACNGKDENVELVKFLTQNQDMQVCVDMLKGMAETLKGRHGLTPPVGWHEVSAKVNGGVNEEAKLLCQTLNSVFGDAVALEALRDTVVDANADLALRRHALESYLAAKVPNTQRLLFQLLGDASLRAEAVRGLATSVDATTPAALLSVYPSLTPSEKVDALNTLAARKEFAQALISAIDHNSIPKSDLNAYTARLLSSLADPDIDAWVKSKWGALQQSSKERLDEMAQYKAAVAKADPNTFDASHGRAVFKKTCAQCHTLFDDGGKVGPDLTGSGRANIDYLMENVVDPNAIVAQEYLTWNIKTKDGRVITGLIRNETPQALNVVTMTETLTLTPDEIAKKVQTKMSLMPEGLLRTLTPDELLDLIAYLRSPMQVPLK